VTDKMTDKIEKGVCMKVTAIKTFLADGGFRPWTFVKIETDSGLIGWGDCTDWGCAGPISKMVERLSEYVIGEDPLNAEYIWWKLSARCVRHAFGIAHKAMAGIDSALWDIRGKYFNAPVWQLLGGRLRDSLPLYWTHFGSARRQFSREIQKPALKTPDDLGELCDQARELGFAAVKTNLIVASVFGHKIPEMEVVFAHDQFRPLLRAARELFAFLRDRLGHDVGIALDVAFSFKLATAIRLAQELEEFDLMWFEAESFNADAVRMLRQTVKTPICMGESLFGAAQYKEFLEKQTADIVMPDLAWNAITMGKRIADLAHVHDVLFAPHNCHSPLTTYISAQVSAAVPNFYMLELDYDDVPWRDEIMTHPFEIKDGKLAVPDRPGLGSDLIEEKLLKYPAGKYSTR
jgi:L-alanine-DL-glutamate epimerase-like enolase superfamily enzyme